MRINGLSRWLGLLPLAFFAWTAAGYALSGQAGELLWICNVSNAALGLALLAGWPTLAWIATLWILLGIPPWLMDAVTVEGFELHSFFTHFGSAVIGIYALARLNKGQPTWWMAYLFFLPWQLLSRVATDPRLNVNSAHEIHPALRGLFSSYWSYYAANAAAFLACLFGVELALRRWVAGRKLPILRGSSAPSSPTTP